MFAARAWSRGCDVLIETLDFEEPIAVLLKEIEALSMLPQRYAKFRRMGNVGLREAPASEVGPAPEPAGG